MAATGFTRSPEPSSVSCPTRSRPDAPGPGEAIGTFREWLQHRQRLVGLDTPQALSQASGIRAAAIDLLYQTNSLDLLERSARGWLARALKVSLRDLESFALGQKRWIEDSILIDLDRPGFAKTRGDEIPRLLKCCQVSRGIPIAGQMSPEGQVQWPAAATESVRRLPVRLDGCAHAFAIERVSTGACFIFLPVLPSDLRPHERVLLNLSDGSIDGRNVTGELAVIGEQVSIVETPSERVEFEMNDILRTARFVMAAAGR